MTEMCNYKDVRCVRRPHIVNDGVVGRHSYALEGLTPELHPCLYKQFRASEHVAWTVPLLPDGSISLNGDCHPLQTPATPRTQRRHAELYQQADQLYRS